MRVELEAVRDTLTEGPAARVPYRQPNRWKVIFVALLVIGMLATLAWVLLGSRLLVVRHVEVSGTKLIARDQVVAAGRISLGSPMVRLDTAAATRRIEGLRQVESASVERDWPGTVRIVVRERVPVAVAVAQGGKVDELDRFGVTVVTAAAPAGLPVLKVASPGPSDPATLAALNALGSLPAELRGRLVSVEAGTPESIIFHLTGNGPVTITWGAAERAPEKLRLIWALTRMAAGRGVHAIDVSSPEVVTTQ
jgi:cell division protein FtsQ